MQKSFFIKNNAPNSLEIRAMGEFTIVPAFLNKILSMAKAGIGWKLDSTNYEL